MLQEQAQNVRSDDCCIDVVTKMEIAVMIQIRRHLLNLF